MNNVFGEKHEILLKKLFTLIDEAPCFSKYQANRKTIIKNKYKIATNVKILNAIKLLEEDISKKNVIEEKRRNLIKNLALEQTKLRALEAEENLKAQQYADELLSVIDSDTEKPSGKTDENKNSTKFVIFLTICAFIYICYNILIRLI